MALQTIGELAKKLSDDFMEQAAHGNASVRIPWKEIKGMRTFLAHNYHDGIDMKKVWLSIKTGVPTLERFCREILQKNDFSIVKIRSVAKKS